MASASAALSTVEGLPWSWRIEKAYMVFLHSETLAALQAGCQGSVSIFFGHEALQAGGGPAAGVNPESVSTVMDADFKTSLAAVQMDRF
jgi:hypothetical protein